MTTLRRINDIDDIPDICVARLPLYLRELHLLLQAGESVVSSLQLAQRVGGSAAQIRKDLSHFGEFGKQGTGYDTTQLCQVLRKVLGIQETWSVVLVGVGKLGRALAGSDYLASQGFRIDALFDNDRRKVGATVGEHRIEHTRHLQRHVKTFGSQIGIIATPASEAQLVADRLARAGTRGILNYAPVALTVPDGVLVQNVDPVLHLQYMTYHLSQGRPSGRALQTAQPERVNSATSRRPAGKLSESTPSLPPMQTARRAALT